MTSWRSLVRVQYRPLAARRYITRSCVHQKRGSLLHFLAAEIPFGQRKREFVALDSRLGNMRIQPPSASPKSLGQMLEPFVRRLVVGHAADTSGYCPNRAKWLATCSTSGASDSMIVGPASTRSSGTRTVVRREPHRRSDMYTNLQQRPVTHRDSLDSSGIGSLVQGHLALFRLRARQQHASELEARFGAVDLVPHFVKLHRA